MIVKPHQIFYDSMKYRFRRSSRRKDAFARGKDSGPVYTAYKPLWLWELQSRPPQSAGPTV